MCHLELDPFGLGWRRARAVAWLWGWLSLPTGPDKMQQVKQSSHCVLKISWTIKVYAPMNNGSVFHFKYSIRGASRSFFSFLQGVFAPDRGTQSITLAKQPVLKRSIFRSSLIYTVNTMLSGNLWRQQRKKRFCNHSWCTWRKYSTFWEIGLFAFIPWVRWEDWYHSYVCMLQPTTG